MRILIRLFKFVIVVLMNLWVYSLVIIWTLLGMLFAFPILFVWQFITKKQKSTIMHTLIWIYGRVCVLIFRPFIRLERKNLGIENIPKSGIIIMNHNSFFDTYMLCQLPDLDAHICVRAWPFKMFWVEL